MNDSIKTQLLWQSTKGFRHKLAMAVGYTFMFGVPLIMKFAIDTIGDVDNIVVPGWLSLVSANLLPDIIFTKLTGISFNSSKVLLYLILCALGIVSLTLLAGLFLYLRGKFMAVAAEGIISSLRNRVYSHIEHLPSQYHDQADTGDLVQRCKGAHLMWKPFVCSFPDKSSKSVEPSSCCLSSCLSSFR